MKLTSTWVDQTQDQFKVEVVPDTHPVVQQLNEVFGQHTFFLGRDGLHIVEPAEPAQDGFESGDVVKLARWGDEKKNTLEPHEPEVVGVVVVHLN
jgi:hypothetical protein